MESKKRKNIEELSEELVKRIIKGREIKINSIYGKFIIQTNEVQFYLGLLILLRTLSPDKKLKKYLEGITFGHLIDCFRICAKDHFELSLIISLNEYKKSRDALAHKMYTNKKLTENECKLSIELGEEILAELKSLLEVALAMKNDL